MLSKNYYILYSLQLSFTVYTYYPQFCRVYGFYDYLSYVHLIRINV